MFATPVVAAASPATQAAPPPASAFAALPAIDEVTLSPDGRTLAYGLDGGTNGAAVVAMDLASGEPRRTYRLGTTSTLRDVTWIDDETLLIEVGATYQAMYRKRPAQHYDVYRRIVLDLHGSEPIVLPTPGSLGDAIAPTIVVGVRRAQTRTVLLALSQDLPQGWNGLRMLYSIDLDTGARQLVDRGTGNATAWLADSDGRPVARSDWLASAREFRVAAPRGDPWTVVHRHRDDRPLTLAAVEPGGGSVLAVGQAGAERSKLWSIGLDGGSMRVIAEDPDYDVEGVLTDRFDGHVTGVRVAGPRGSIRWLDAAARALHDGVARAFPERDVEVYDRSRDGSRVLARVSGPASPAVYYVVDVAKRSAVVVGETCPALANVPLGLVQAISYAARDGTQIPAYLTLPPGGATRNLPLIVVPHDGPESHDRLGYDWFVQFLATRGYAVLQPQFRGSTGYGTAWRRAANEVWGGLMQDDLSDGVAAMVRQGIADPSRVCIAGRGYGGYAALAGAAFTPALYRCAISIAGLADLTARLPPNATGPDQYPGFDYDTDYRLKIAGRSPTQSAAAVLAPILLLHGTLDSVVPLRQSELMVAALTRAGKAHEFVRLEGGDHTLSKAATRTQVLTEIERFLQRNLN